MVEVFLFKDRRDEKAVRRVRTMIHRITHCVGASLSFRGDTECVEASLYAFHTSGPDFSLSPKTTERRASTLPTEFQFRELN